MTVTGAEREQFEAALIERLPHVVLEVGERLSEHWPDYAEFLRTDRQGVVEAAEPFIHGLVEMADPATIRARSASDGRGAHSESIQLVFEQVGRQQLRAGNDLTRLLTAFQLGARVAWQHVSATGLEMGLPPTSLASLADAVFVFVNRLSFAAARGYLQAQVEDSRGLERSREDLAELLLSGTPSDEAVRSAATRVGWRIPERVALALVDPDDEVARGVVDRLGPDCLPLRRRDLYGAIVPDPGSSAGRTFLSRQLKGAHAVVGYAVPLDRLPRSIDFVEMVIDLRRRGVISGDPVFSEDHLDTIIVCRDPNLIQALSHQVLGPLDDLPEGAHQRLTETLASWLRHQGDHRAMAEELSIHPQTVRYRLNQLHELFGDSLEDPRSRARLFLVLTWPTETV